MPVVMSKPNSFLDSLKQMVTKPTEIICSACQKAYSGKICPTCGSLPSDTEQDDGSLTNVAYLVDLVSNHKITVAIPLCKVGRDESNDIVVSGDQSISRQHLIISKDEEQYFVQDAGSRHGTFLNGAQIHAQEHINDGDVLKFGVSLFWFVIETAPVGENLTPPTSVSTSGEISHIKVKSSAPPMPSSPSSSTANEIPAIPNNMSLLDHLRLKTRSFDQSDLLDPYQPHINESAPVPAQAPILPPPLPQVPIASSKPEKIEAPIPAMVEFELFLAAEASNPISPDEPLGADLSKLVNKYREWKDQIEQTQKHMQEIADQIITINELRSSLMGDTSATLVNACQKVFTQLGWQCRFNEQDSKELQLKVADQFSIARVVWDSDQPERTHLGQLSMSQTRFWCEQGQEPKGILIISKIGKGSKQLPTLTEEDYQSELSSYAAQKNVCMMTSAQVLAIYRDLVVKHLDSTELREKIIGTKGWLEGFNLESPVTGSQSPEEKEIDHLVEA